MLRNYFYLVLLILLATSLPLLNAGAFSLPSQCYPTPAISSDRAVPLEPGKTNNLRRATGSPLTIAGTPIMVKGILLDSNCVPISDAVIVLWQADKNGHFTRSRTATPALTGEFAGSGTATTDNRGEFTFLTIMPGGYEARAPHLHLQITHPDFTDFDTDLFFDDAIHQDAKAQKLSSSAREGLLGKKSILLGQSAYSFIITLGEKGTYRQY